VNGAAFADKELDAQFFFQFGDLQAQSRLRNEKMLRRIGEVRVLGCRNEISQLAKLHRRLRVLFAPNPTICCPNRTPKAALASFRRNSRQALAARGGPRRILNSDLGNGIGSTRFSIKIQNSQIKILSPVAAKMA
jgi:hypothetical protein